MSARQLVYLDGINCALYLIVVETLEMYHTLPVLWPLFCGNLSYRRPKLDKAQTGIADE